MQKILDVLVIGLGAHGSAALYHLSKTGCNVFGIDQYKPPHALGSSHGQSRIIRQAYHESPFYVPFVKEAYRLWNEIEREAGANLFLQTGGLILGAEDAAIITGARLSAETHGITYRYLNSRQIGEQFPALRPTASTVGLLEAHAGIMFPERCVQTCLDLALRNGAAVQFDEAVQEIIPGDSAVEVVTGSKTYKTLKLVISAGAWLTQLVPGLKLPLTIERQVLYWLKNRRENDANRFMPDRLPVYIWEYSPGELFYGFPDLGDGIKIAFHHSGELIEPAKLVTKDINRKELDNILAVAGTYFDMDPVYHYSLPCMYTNTPDEHFIIDVHPQYPNIIIASPCSGHGFKFASCMGKILSNMATGSSIGFDLSPFSLSRFDT